ncbi:MAG: hypothetical protein U9P42_07115, partial [Candidatus Fermentibacteria bacterium]|nr:hypothetical protein [Candidatus Fermentibacteria bacterium]
MKGTFAKLTAFIFLYVFLLVFVAHAQPVMLTDSLSTINGEFVMVSGGKVIFVNTTGSLRSVNIQDPFNTSPFMVDWTAAENGWAGQENISFLKSSPDGNRVCIGMEVSIPDSVMNRGLSMPEPIVIVVCNSSGGGAQAVGVTTDSGDGLSFDFTQDSRLLYGAGFLPCLPNSEAYFAHYLGDESSSLSRFDVIDLEENARFSANGLIGDFFTGNPWSDLITAGNEPYYTIADMVTFSVVFEDSTLISPVVEQWVEPDAGLAILDSLQILRLSDGTVFVNREAPFIILCRLSEGNYIFTRDEGETFSRGKVIWSTFEEEETVELTELAGYLSVSGKVLLADPG